MMMDDLMLLTVSLACVIAGALWLLPGVTL